MPGYPCCHNINDIAITIMKVNYDSSTCNYNRFIQYRSPAVAVQQLRYALNEVLSLSCSQFNIFNILILTG